MCTWLRVCISTVALPFFLLKLFWQKFFLFFLSVWGSKYFKIDEWFDMTLYYWSISFFVGVKLFELPSCIRIDLLHVMTRTKCVFALWSFCVFSLWNHFLSLCHYFVYFASCCCSFLSPLSTHPNRSRQVVAHSEPGSSRGLMEVIPLHRHIVFARLTSTDLKLELLKREYVTAYSWCLLWSPPHRTVWQHWDIW